MRQAITESYPRLIAVVALAGGLLSAFLLHGLSQFNPDFAALERYNAEPYLISAVDDLEGPHEWVFSDEFVDATFGSRIDVPGTVWFKIAVPDVSLPEVYLPYPRGMISIFTGGRWIAGDDPSRYITRNSRAGAIYPLREGTDEILIQYRRLFPIGPQAIYVGPKGAFDAYVARQTVAATILPTIVLAVSLSFVMLFLVLFAVDPRRERVFLYTALLIAAAGSRALFDLVGYPPLPYGWWLFLNQSALLSHLILPFILVELFRLPRKHLKAAWWFVGVGAVITVAGAVMMATRPVQLFGWYSFGLHLFLFAFVPFVAVQHLIATRRHRSWQALAVTISCTIVFIGGSRDFYVDWFAPEPWFQYSLPLCFVFMAIAYGLVVVLRYQSSKSKLGNLVETMEEKLEERTESLSRSFERLRQLERDRTLSDERRRIMRDVHDGLGSQLVQALSIVSEKNPDDAELKEKLNTALTDLRLIVNSLNPDERHLEALVANFKYYFDRSTARRNENVEWRMRGLEYAELGPEKSLVVLRILQEALTNVLKHARAENVLVCVFVQDGFLEFSVKDDGVGFECERNLRGLGLESIRERCRALDAELSISSSDAGSEIRVRLPLAQHAERAGQT